MKNPPIDPAVVEWLERMFPDKLPDSTTVSHRDIDVRIGEQLVIRRLRLEVTRQTSNIVR